VAKFPVKALHTITGEPDYGNINHMIQQLYNNATSVATSLGGGRQGHIGLIMIATLCATLSDTAYVTPADPGALPTVPPTSTTGVRKCINTCHKERLHIFNNNIHTDDALKAQIVGAIHYDFITEKSHKYTRFLEEYPHETYLTISSKAMERSLPPTSKTAKTE
jgi:hypothetical protein